LIWALGALGPSADGPGFSLAHDLFRKPEPTRIKYGAGFFRIIR
jgi:hypothetical protein